ncbi:hypothetical protein ACI78V_10270 [Geodermatophilus sp. SYSU D00742]
MAGGRRGGRQRSRRSGGRRRGRGGRRYGTAVGVVAAGLVTLSAPATQVAAQLTAVSTPSRPSAPVPVVPPAAALAADTATVAVPVAPPIIATGPAPPAPRGVDVDVPHPMVPRGMPLETEPREDLCGGYPSPRRISPAVVPGPGTAAVSWQADGHADVRRYRVQAVSQRLVTGVQPAPPQQVVGRPAGCEQVGVTFTGLEPGVSYVFWLEEEVEDSLSPRWVQVGSTTPVTIG